MPMNHSASFMFFRTATRSPAGSEIPTEGNREYFQAFSLQIRCRVIPLLVMTTVGTPLNFQRGARKDPVTSSSKLQQEAWLKQTEIFAFILIIILCLFM